MSEPVADDATGAVVDIPNFDEDMDAAVATLGGETPEAEPVEGAETAPEEAAPEPTAAGREADSEPEPETPAEPDWDARVAQAAEAHAARQRQEALSAREAQLAEREQAFQELAPLVEAFQAVKKSGGRDRAALVKYMQAAELTPDGFARAMLDEPAPEPPPEVKRAMTEVEKVRSELEALRQEQAQERQQAQLNQFLAAIPEKVTRDTFPTLTAWSDSPAELSQAVYQRMVQLHAQGGGAVPTVTDAARSLEQQLVARAKRLGLKVPGQGETGSSTAPANKPTPKTLTNDLTASTDAVREPETDEERWEKALAIFEGRVSA